MYVIQSRSTFHKKNFSKWRPRKTWVPNGRGADMRRARTSLKKIGRQTNSIFLTFRDLRNSRFSDFSLFSRIWKNNSFKIEFSMKNDPIRFNFQVSTTFRRGVNRVKTKKISAFFTQNWLTHFPEKVWEVTNITIFRLFIFSSNLKEWFIENRILHEKWPHML